MSRDNLPKKQIGPRPLWFVALLLLDAFALGGLVAMELVRQLLESIGNRLITVEAQAEILNILDHLTPYWLGYVGVSLLLGLITAGAYLWLKTRSRIVITLTLMIPLILLVSFFALRVVSTATSPAPPPTTPTAPATTQPAATTTPIRVDLTPAQRAAMQALVAAVNVPVDQIKLISTEAVQWPDGCLGIVHLGVMCLQGLVDGFRIILEANGQQYEFHTNQDGTSIGQLAALPGSRQETRRFAELRDLLGRKRMQRAHRHQIAQPGAADFRNIRTIVIQRHLDQFAPRRIPGQQAHLHRDVVLRLELIQQRLNEVGVGSLNGELDFRGHSPGCSTGNSVSMTSVSTTL